MKLACSLALSLLPSLAMAQEATPPVPTAPVAAKPKAKPAAKVYDEQADARKDVAAAVARAKRDNKRVLIQWGANWCGWCVWLSGTMKSNGAIARKVLYEYEVVHVDMGQFDKNKELAEELGAKFKAIPYLTVLDADGKSLVQQNTEPFEVKGDEAAHHDPKKVLAFLTEHQAAPLDAATVRAAAFARAKVENKRVFLHFGAPWCGWCHRLEAWMARPEIAPILAKDFVDLKIDQDRMTGGKEMVAAEMERAGAKGGGIPWFVFCAAEGEQLANSNGPAGNVGFPFQPEEVAHFEVMLNKVRVNITEADVAALVASLHANREADKAK